MRSFLPVRSAIMEIMVLWLNEIHHNSGGGILKSDCADISEWYNDIHDNGFYYYKRYYYPISFSRVPS